MDLEGWYSVTPEALARHQSGADLIFLAGIERDTAMSLVTRASPRPDLEYERAHYSFTA